MHIVVAICTHNRVAPLTRALMMLARQVVDPTDHAETVVVANACTDDTLAAAMRFQSQLLLTVLSEDRPGISRARNRALEFALERHAELILYLDDDIDAHSTLVRSYISAAKGNPLHGVFGGPITPVFETAPGRIIEDGLAILGTAFGRLEYGDADSEKSATEMGPFGGNMAFATRVIGSRRFDPTLGVTPTRRMGGEETYFVRNIIGESGTWMYVGRARVQHIVPPARCNIAHAKRYYRSEGARAEFVDGGRRPKLWVLRRLLEVLILDFWQHVTSADACKRARTIVARETLVGRVLAWRWTA